MDRIVNNLNPLTEYAILFISLVGIYFQITWSRRGTALGPTLLTTLGIFFCFLGIALGLSDFDANNVKSSVPHLLQGIRTSFWVSVSGIGWALTIKIRLALFGDAAVPADRVDSATVDDIVWQLVQLNAAITGGEQASLLGQTKLLRSDLKDGFHQLSHALETYAERSAEQNSRALIQALSEVVHDFNTKLNEQFGDNFKQLNVAVARLVTWQAQYEQQLNVLIDLEAATSRTMSAASLQYATLVDHSTVFVRTAESLGTSLDTLSHERENLAAGLGMLGRLIDNAAVGLPKIETSIVEMTNQIARGVQANSDMLGSVLKNSWQSIQVHNQHLTAILAKTLDGTRAHANESPTTVEREARASAT